MLSRCEVSFMIDHVGSQTKAMFALQHCLPSRAQPNIRLCSTEALHRAK